MKSVNEIADEYEGTTSWISIAFLYISAVVRFATAGASLYYSSGACALEVQHRSSRLNLFLNYGIHFKLMLPSSRIPEVDILRDANCVSETRSS
jgi:hypothetical protein